MPQQMSLQQFAAALKKRVPQLANVPDEELVRKALDRRPQLMQFLTQAPQAPQNSMETSLYTNIGGRLRENLNLPVQAQSAATAIHEGLRNIREHGPSKMPAFLSALGEYKKPENVIGDALTALIMGSDTKGAEPAAPRSMIPPRAESLFESQARMPIDPLRIAAKGAAEQNAILQTLVDNLRAKLARERGAGDSQAFQTLSKLREAEDRLKATFGGQKYVDSPQTHSTQGGGGANYTADDLAALKKKWGIQ